MLVAPPFGASSNIALWRAYNKPPVELVVADSAASSYGDNAALHYYDGRRVRLPADGWIMGKPPVEEQPDGRPVQQRKRIVHAGDTPSDQ